MISDNYNTPLPSHRNGIKSLMKAITFRTATRTRMKRRPIQTAATGMGIQANSAISKSTVSPTYLEE